MDRLSPYAALALRHVAAGARGGPVEPGWRVTLNFHPERTGADGRTVIERIAAERLYRSQFETGTSNGGLTAHEGGDRWRWEQRIFGAAYDGAPAAERPKYGALDDEPRGVGGAPRFGSAHLRLTRATLGRTTFCYPDSVFEPEHLGVASAVTGLVEQARSDRAAGRLDPLDEYVEAHVHGPLDLATDVEAVVLDPCFRGGAVEEAAAQLPCPVEWHGGFEVTVEVVREHAAYRGPEVVALAERIAADGRLDPAVVGAAAATGRHDPQRLKQVWHVLARFGRPPEPSTRVYRV